MEYFSVFDFFSLFAHLASEHADAIFFSYQTLPDYLVSFLFSLSDFTTFTCLLHFISVHTTPVHCPDGRCGKAGLCGPLRPELYPVQLLEEQILLVHTFIQHSRDLRLRYHSRLLSYVLCTLLKLAHAQILTHRFSDNENSLPKLNKAQLSRLRQLTLIGLVQDKIDVPIDTIRADLCLESETWLLDLMSLNNQVAIKFKIDEVGQIIHVEHLTQTRDVLSSQDKPLRILSRDQVGCDVSRLINMLKFIRDVKLAKVKDALSGSEKAAEDAASTRRSSQLKRRLEG